MNIFHSKPVLSKQEVNALSQEGHGGIDPRFLKTSGVEAFTGNELLLKGALEAGVALLTGYPGSPVSDVFEVISTVRPYLLERGIVAQIANNEGLAASRLNGARQAGLRAMAVMKSVGFHVGADGLAVGNLMETRQRQGGAVVVVGDDPWNETTQINSDSRFLSRHLNMPLLEPGTFQELKDWIDVAFDLSGASDLYITYLITTNLADGGGSVTLKPHPELAISRDNKTTLSSDKIKISDHVLIPPHTSMREATLDERFGRVLKRAGELGINQWFGPRKKRLPVGFISSGISSSYLREVLELLGLWDNVPVLKLGLTYPLDAAAVEDMAARVSHLVVVEEKRGFLEGQVAEILVDLKQSGKLFRPPALWGKKFPDGEEGFPSKRGLNTSIILKTLGPSFLRWKRFFPTLIEDQVLKELEEIVDTRSSSFEVPARTPTFCPGCPHRDSAIASLALKNKLKNPDLIFHGESGCHSMLQFPPNEGLMQNYSGMGLGGGTGAGMSPFVKNKQVVFLGDGTFFHSGMIAISDSIKNNQEITYIILDNQTTAMTGHQPTPGNSVDIMGRITEAQNIERIIRGMAGEGVFIQRANPGLRDEYEKLLEQTILKPGVKIIIADKECSITLHRRMNAQRKAVLKELGFIPHEERFNITPEVCDYCLECTRQTGCPGLTIEETPYGRKIVTDLSTCVDDGACSKTKACPSFEKVVIQRNRPIPEKKPIDFDVSKLPLPKPLKVEHRWSAYTAGVGGMGAGIVDAVLVRAGIKEGYKVSFLDKKGLAIRNGGVYGHVVFSAQGEISSPVIPYGKADLLIGLDILEAARALDARMNLRVAHPARTHAVVNTHRNETILSLMGREDFDPGILEEVIQGRVCFGGYYGEDFALISEKYLGSKLFVNMMVLGAAYQKGWIPLAQENILKAIEETVRKADIPANFTAFNLGRYLVLNPTSDFSQRKNRRLADLISEKADYLSQESYLFGRWRAKEYRKLIDRAYLWMDLPKPTLHLLARALYDLVRRDGLKTARKYISLVWETYQRDQSRFGFRATQAVVKNLFHVMAFKDEFWVAKLLISPEKYARDRERFQIDAGRGDKVNYVHFTRPRISIFGKTYEFPVQSRDWMLQIVAQFKFLRGVIPGWHQEEKSFSDWYVGVVKGFSYFESEEEYGQYVQALEAPGIVRGYREIRYPLMNKARQKATGHLEAVWLSSSQTRPELPKFKEKFASVEAGSNKDRPFIFK